MDEHIIAKNLRRIGDPFIDAIPCRNKEGKKDENISPLSYREWDM